MTYLGTKFGGDGQKFPADLIYTASIINSNTTDWTMTELTASAILKEGNTAVITGASSGIGRAAALYCASKGMNVWMVDIDANELDAATSLVSKGMTSSEKVSFSTIHHERLQHSIASHQLAKTRKLSPWWWTCRIRRLSSR